MFLEGLIHGGAYFRNFSLRPPSQTPPSPVSILPACRHLLFPLLHAEKGCLRNAVTNRVPASCCVPKILGKCCDRLTHSAHSLA